MMRVRMLARRHALALVLSVLAGTQLTAAADVAPSPVSPGKAAGALDSPADAWTVYRILHQSCTECHGGHLTKPKAKMGYILDLPRLIDEMYIAPGDPGGSDIYLALTSSDEDEVMPPPDSDGHKPTAAEIETIRAWIAAGAPLGNASSGETSTSASTASDETAAEADAENLAGVHPWPRRFGRLHPLIVHFPIALLLCACGAELAARIRPTHATWLQGATRGSLWVAAVGALLAAGFGWLNAAYEGHASAETDVHRWLGVVTAGLALVALLVSERAERTRTRGARATLLLVLVLSAVVVTLAGHTGGVLAYGPDYLGW